MRIQIRALSVCLLTVVVLASPNRGEAAHHTDFGTVDAIDHVFPPGGGTYPGTQTSATDDDWLVFSATAGTPLTVRITAHGDAIVVAAVFREVTNGIVEIGDAADVHDFNMDHLGDGEDLVIQHDGFRDWPTDHYTVFGDAIPNTPDAGVTVTYSFPAAGTGQYAVGISAPNEGPTYLGDYTVEVIANTPPVADAGPNQTVSCDSADGAIVMLDGTGSSDPDGDPLTFEWSVPPGVILDNPASPTPLGDFPVGITTATLTVTDGNGGIDCDDVMITVVDDLPPEVACTTDIGALWPPNHQMVPVAVAIYATDECSDPGALQLLGVALQSSEPDDADGSGDGETIGDADGEDGYSGLVDVTGSFVFDDDRGAFLGEVLLRAERAGEGSGRTYAINAAVRDSVGNVVETSCVVVVPHDRRGGK